MKRTNGSPPSGHGKFSVKRRAQLLAAFDRSGLSAAAFARKHGLNYTTFCGWRQRRPKHSSPQFVEVELPAPPPVTGLVIELGDGIRLPLNHPDQVQLAARLIRSLNTRASC